MIIIQYTLFNNIISYMLKLNKLLNCISNAEPHLKAISKTGVKSRNLIFNPTVPQLYELAFLNQTIPDIFTKPSFVSINGALSASSGLKKAIEPQNSRIVKDSETDKLVDWNNPTNIPMDYPTFQLIENLAVDFINHKQRCFVIDGYLGWDPKYRMKVRTFCTRTYHALFMRNMLIRPTEKQYEEDFSKGVDITIFNAGQMSISKRIPGLNATSITAMSLSLSKLVIMGTQLAGQMNKNAFKLLHYYYPRKNILPMHAAGLQSQNGNTTIMCGLSGTGKTSLGLRSHRKIIGDDETIWTDDGIFNTEGGIYGKVFNLDHQVEPGIFNAIRYGTVVENSAFYRNQRSLNFNDSSQGENSRAAFPLSYLPNFNGSGKASHPKNIIFLTCDTNGVLPPAAKLSPEQARYHFLSGYSAKKGDKKSESMFSSCFGQMFLSLPPQVYANLFYDKIRKHNVNVWLVNTGWTSGRYGVGKRIDFSVSQKIVDAIIDGSLDSVPTHNFKCFNLQVPNEINGVDQKVLHPQKGWNSQVEYEKTLSVLAKDFQNNFKSKFAGISNFDEVQKAGPQAD